MDDCEALTQKKAKLRWHCRRGMLELDIILARFVERHIDSLNTDQLDALALLLSQNDPDIYAWLMGLEQPKDKELAEIVNTIQLHDTLR